MSNLALRSGVAADKEAVMAVVGAAFRIPVGSDRWHHLAEQYAAPGHTWRVVEKGGELVAALCVIHSVLRVGEGHAIKGDVGEVAVMPGHQGQGIGTALMRDTVGWLCAGEYDFSRLGGLVRFYSRFGYVPFVRRYVEFYLRQGVSAGASSVAPAYLEPPKESRVSPLATTEEQERCQEIDAGWNGWRVGALHKASPLGSRADVLVYREGERIVAWVQLAEFPTDRTEFESRLTISGGACEPGREDALAVLVAHVLRLAHDRGHDHVSARFPFDPDLFSALTEAGLPFKAVELHEAGAATMVQVLNLRSLFEHLLPALERRWSEARLPRMATVTLESAGQSATLDLAPGRVAIGEEPREPRLRLSQPGLISLVLGHHSARYVLGRKAPSGLLTVLETLFPEQLVTSSGWG